MRVPSPRTTIRVLVVDDHPAIQEALACTINGKMDMELVGRADSAEDAFQVMQQEKANVAVIDVSLRDAHGLDLVQNLRAQYPELQVVVFSMYDESVYAERAIRAGASGYVMKNEPTGTVVEALRCVSRGEIYLSRRMASRMLNKLAQRNTSAPSFALEELTDREMVVFQMMGQGYSVDEISEKLKLSRKTVETYRRRAKEKLDFESIGELLQYAIQWTYGQVGQ